MQTEFAPTKTSVWASFREISCVHPAVFWSCVDSTSSKTSLNASFTVIATLVRFHSLRIFHKQSIRWALICTSCSTEQPTVCSVNCWCNFSIYWGSTTRVGGASSLLRRDWMLVCWCEDCLACISNNGTRGCCCPCWGGSFGCDWLPFGTLFCE